MVVRHSLHRHFLAFARLLAVVALFAPFAGCELLHPSDTVPTATRKLPNLQIPPNSVCLDVMLVERPRGDSLVGQQLWDRVDQVQSLEPEVRETLKANGFRLGVVGTNPPRALQQLMGEKPDFQYEAAAENAKQLSGHRFFIAAGSNVRIVASPIHETCELEIEREGEPQTLALNDAECRFRLAVKQKQPGWAQLEFVPQVFHGPNQRRWAADELDWKYEESQRAETFFPQRFSLTLGVGEMAVIAADGVEGKKLGQLFFTGRGVKSSQDGDEETMDVERLLIIRLTAANESDLR
ncbi:MAG: hypothetical protein NT069_06345 [Planctomycetota bacterium]|nr:hypothetical protein [Planctomycetota bacterium]